MPVNCVGSSSTSSSNPSSPPSLSGEVILPTRYQDMEQIGQGATCIVLKARDSFLDRTVAIKLMRAELTDFNSVRRFQQEARMMSSFNLMHLPVVLDFGLSPSGRPYMVMELLAGLSLKQTVVCKKLSVELVLEITIQILSALEHAHERGVVHRDLKSQNIMVTWGEDGKPLIKVVDFGLAGEINRPRTITECGAALGTPFYMSPEQAQGCAADARSDLYSLGCIMFEMLTGHTPFRKGSAAETINAHIHEVAPAVRAIVKIDSDALSELESVVARLLEKKPAKRYQSARELKEELESLIEKMQTPTEQTDCLFKQQIEPPSAGFTSWTNIRAIKISNNVIGESALTEGAGWLSSSQEQSFDKNGKNFDVCSNSTRQLSECFSLTIASRRAQDFTMIVLVVALTILSAAALIWLEPVFMPVSAKPAALQITDSLNPVTKLEREARAQLSEHPSALTQNTFNATVGGKFHVSEADLWALPSLGDSDLSMIRDFPAVRNLNLITSQSVTGVGFHQIKKLPIESMDLRNLTIAQAGFDALGEMRKLKTLHLDFMPFITVSKIRSLRAAPALSTLTCKGTHLSALCQSEIAKMPHLRELLVTDSSGLNDSSLELFARMPELKRLSIGRTPEISKGAIERFKQSRPDVQLEL